LSPLAPLRWAWLQVRRSLGGDLQAMPVSPGEQALLEARGILDPTLQRFAVWRKSILLLVIPPTLFGAVIYTQRVVHQGFDSLSVLGAALVVIDALMLYLLPAAALLAAWTWTHHRTSHQILFRGWVIVFLFPIIYALMPIPWQVKFSGTEEEREVQRKFLEGYGMLLGLAYYVALMPTVMSLIPGLIRACVRMKSLMPAFIVPGWFLMAAAPLYLLLWLVVFVAINRVAGNALLIVGMMLYIGAPMIYVLRAETFLRPLDTREGGRSIGRVQIVVNACLFVAVALLVVYGFTKTVLGIPLLGTNQETSLVYMLQQLRFEEGQIKMDQPHNPESIVWIGDLHIYRYLLEYMGRSLYMTVIFADLLIRLELTVWTQEQEFFHTAAAADYDHFMGDLKKAYEGRSQASESPAPPSEGPAPAGEDTSIRTKKAYEGRSQASEGAAPASEGPAPAGGEDTDTSFRAK
jgi:hypothetical protein